MPVTVTSLLTEFLNLLEGDAALGALLGTGQTMRVFPLVIEQKAPLPQIAYQRISWPEEGTHDGGRYATPRLQLSCWAETYDAAVAVGDAVVARLANVASGIIQRVKIEDDADDRDPETGYYRRRVDVTLAHEAA